MQTKFSFCFYGFLSTALPSAVLADQVSGSNYYGDHPMMWGNWFMGPMMMIFMVLIVAVAVVVVLKLFGVGRAPDDHTSQESAIAILKERFARGEIDQDEYEERKRVLGA